MKIKWGNTFFYKNQEIAGTKKLEVAKIEETAAKIAQETLELARDAQKDLGLF